MVHPIRQGRTPPGGEGHAAAAAQAAGEAQAAGGTRAAGGGRAASAARAAASARVAGPATGGTTGIRLTGRGAGLGMFALFFLGLLISAGLGWAWLAGAAFAGGSVVAARYTHRRDLLTVAVSPPLLFLCALLLVKVLTASGHVLVSAAAGVMLTLAGVAPWLFGGMAASLLICVVRGLPGCVRELRRDLRGDPGYSAGGAGSRRATPQ